MRDFLDVLAERSFGVRANLRPRLMPTFETAPVDPPEASRPPFVPYRVETVEEGVASGRRTAAPQESMPEAAVPPKAVASSVSPATPETRISTPVPGLEPPPVPNRADVPDFDAISPVMRGGETRVEPGASTTLTEIVRILPERPAAALNSRLPAWPAAPVSPQPTAGEPVERPPSVEIHIGRVEVRAQFAAPAKRESPKPRVPALSLDRYLEERR